MTKSFKIDSREISEAAPCYIIAEAGVNHNGDVERAKKMIEAAKAAGADAVKFQTFKAENLNTRTAPKASYHVETTGAAGSWFDLLKTQELDHAAHVILANHCKRVGITFLSTPYDTESVDLLESVGVDGYKIASTDSNNLPFLQYVAQRGRPVILSTAMCTLAEVAESVATIRDCHNDQLAVLHCTASYPASSEFSNLRAMLTIRDTFGVIVGYSDHTMDAICTTASIALGAKVFEKHFTMDKNLPGPDHRASQTPDELAQTVALIRATEKALGNGVKEPQSCEVENRQKLRKSVVAKINIAAGTTLTEDMLTIKRPGLGIPPKGYWDLIGKKVAHGTESDTLITWDMVQ